MPGNDNSATSSLFLLVDSVLDSETSCLDRIVEDGSIFIVTNTTKIDDRVVREHVLGTSSGVLTSSTSNQFCRVVVQEIFVDSKMFFFCEDGIVGFETVLFEKSVITLCLDVYKYL